MQATSATGPSSEGQISRYTGKNFKRRTNFIFVEESIGNIWRQVPRKEAEPRQGKQRGKDQSVGYYGKWSKWSPCTRLCTTQRHRWIWHSTVKDSQMNRNATNVSFILRNFFFFVFNSMDGRWCKKPGICGRDVIRESAYCYVEGSFCQRWVHRKIRGSQEEDIDGEYNEPLNVPA